MTQYIDKSALVAEIERRKNICQGVAKANENNEFTHLYYKGKTEAYSEMSEFLDTLEVKEMDLEKEIEEYAYSLPHGTTGSCSYVSDKRLPIARQFGIKHNWDYEKVENIAEHFFELGLKESNPLT